VSATVNGPEELTAALTALAGDPVRRPLLVALDFDGVLAPLVDDPDASRMLPPAAWALARLGAREHYEVGTVGRFFDSLTAATREAAWAWLVEGSAGYDDPVLWSRLAETPFDDLKLKLVDLLARRAAIPGLSTDQLAPVWCAVLLGVHRGGRQKLKAVRDIAAAVARTPDQAGRLLPVLAVAVRSVRGPERRAGLAAVMTLLAVRPELSALVRASLPELHFATTEVAA